MCFSINVTYINNQTTGGTIRIIRMNHKKRPRDVNVSPTTTKRAKRTRKRRDTRSSLLLDLPTDVVHDISFRHLDVLDRMRVKIALMGDKSDVRSRHVLQNVFPSVEEQVYTEQVLGMLLFCARNMMIRENERPTTTDRRYLPSLRIVAQSCSLQDPTLRELEQCFPRLSDLISERIRACSDKHTHVRERHYPHIDVMYAMRSPGFVPNRYDVRAFIGKHETDYGTFDISSCMYDLYKMTPVCFDACVPDVTARADLEGLREEMNASVENSALFVMLNNKNENLLAHLYGQTTQTSGSPFYDVTRIASPHVIRRNTYSLCILTNDMQAMEMLLSFYHDETLLPKDVLEQLLLDSVRKVNIRVARPLAARFRTYSH